MMSVEGKTRVCGRRTLLCCPTTKGVASQMERRRRRIRARRERGVGTHGIICASNTQWGPPLQTPRTQTPTSTPSELLHKHRNPPRHNLAKWISEQITGCFTWRPPADGERRAMRTSSKMSELNEQTDHLELCTHVDMALGGVGMRPGPSREVQSDLARKKPTERTMCWEIRRWLPYWKHLKQGGRGPEDAMDNQRSKRSP